MDYQGTCEGRSRGLSVADQEIGDEEAEFYFVPAERVMSEAERLGATSFDVKGVELGHHRKECSFEAILKKYDLTKNPALALMGKIVNGTTCYGSSLKRPD